MLCILFVCIFYSKIINDEIELNRIAVMNKKAVSMRVWAVAMLGEDFDETLVGYFNGMW